MKSKKTLIILGHPNKESYCGALAESYFKGAIDNNQDIKMFALSDLKFDPILWNGYKSHQPLEDDLKRHN
ncbi:MAG: hypothetical protein WCJ19_05430 [bacterium]